MRAKAQIEEPMADIEKVKVRTKAQIEEPMADIPKGKSTDHILSLTN